MSCWKWDTVMGMENQRQQVYFHKTNNLTLCKESHAIKCDLVDATAFVICFLQQGLFEWQR